VTTGPAAAARPRLPYGRQWIDEEDIQAVVEVLRSDWLTTGPAVETFEREFAARCGARHAVAVANGTAALHVAVIAAGVGPGDDVIVPAMTFAATANCVAFQGGTPVFADVDRETLLVDPASIAARLTPRTKAVIAVDYTGQPCDYDALRDLARRRGLVLIADACHAVGGSDRGRPVGSLADLSTFSFHPVKHITTGEGGMVTTDREEDAAHMRRARNHGFTTEFRQRERGATWVYEMVELGWNYRLTDLQCALGLSQLRRLDAWVRARQALAREYARALARVPGVRPLGVRPGVEHAYHLFVVRLEGPEPGPRRARTFRGLVERGIGANVHYIPVHLHPYYRQRFGTGPGLCPVAEDAYERIISLPMFPRMTTADVERVVTALAEALA
jgi:perosamine synthetase